MRALVSLLAALACICTTVGSAWAAAPPRLKVEGKRLVDARSGRTFVPRGVNWPSFEYACFYGYGYSDVGGPEHHASDRRERVQDRRLAHQHRARPAQRGLLARPRRPAGLRRR